MHQRVGSATHCHLDKTNMDKTSQHLQIMKIYICEKIIQGDQFIAVLILFIGNQWALVPGI